LKTISISLDFEIRWGFRHLYLDNFAEYSRNLLGADYAANKLCEILDDYKIPSSWAVVGSLALNNWDELFTHINLQQLNKTSFFNFSKKELLDSNLNYYFAPNTVAYINSNKFTELCSHTFNHIFCSEKNITKEIFVNDGQLIKKVFNEKFNIVPTSLVFPRNQKKYVECLNKIGIKHYRELEIGDDSDSNTLDGNTLNKQAIRYLTSINPFIKHSTNFNKSYSIASMFLRLNLPNALWKLHVYRIKNELNKLDNNECFHLWWHPHNLGDYFDIRIKRVREILNIINFYRNEKDYKILTMDQLGKQAF